MLIYVCICVFKHTHNNPVLKIPGTRCILELIIFHILKIQCISKCINTPLILSGAASCIQIYSYFHIKMHDISYNVS